MKFKTYIARNRSENNKEIKSFLRVKITFKGDFFITLPITYIIEKSYLKGRVVETKLFVMAFGMIGFIFFIRSEVYDYRFDNLIVSIPFGLITYGILRYYTSKSVAMFLKEKKKQLRE